MKKIALSILLLTFLFSCKKDAPTIVSKVDIKPEIIADSLPSKNKQVSKTITGYWVGAFIAKKYTDELVYGAINKISINITSIANNDVIGESIVAGNLRTLKGTFKKDNGNLSFKLTEPGDDIYDGVFKFKIVGDTLIGDWFANNKKINITQREFKLVLQDFKYDPKRILHNNLTDWYNRKTTKEDYGGELYDVDVYRAASEKATSINGSTTKLDEKMLKNLKKIDLEIIRNTIYARHGLSFKKKTFRQFYDPVDWYIPVSKDVSADLTDLEKKNELLLKRFEKYATDNYDYYGR